MQNDQIAHLAGVFDAVGAITVHVSKKEDRRIGYSFSPLVSMTRPTTQERLRRKLDAYCEANAVQHSVGKKTRPDSQDAFLFEVKSPEAIRRFLHPMKGYFVVQDENVTIMLEEILPRVEADEHLTKPGLYELMGYADVLRETSRYGGTAKYTQSYFADLWREEVIDG